jgi:hypothetical protein
MNGISLPGFDFKPIRLDDRAALTDFLKKYPQPLTGYTFATLAAWQPFFGYEWAFAEPETLLVSCILDPDPNRQLLQPVGLLSPSVAQLLVKKAEDFPYTLKIVGVCDRFLNDHAAFSRSFNAAEDRAVSNYVYHTASLVKLPGRKYARKRNLMAQAEGLYSWSCQTLTPALTSSCFAVLDSILEEENPQVEGMLKRELSALEYTLLHLDELSQQGLLISVDGRPVAFSIYEPINPSTAAVHFERALRSYKGLYQVINWETAKAVAAEGFAFINREEDLGDAGLRDAKMSYYPAEIVKAYELTYRKTKPAAQPEYSGTGR